MEFFESLKDKLIEVGKDRTHTLKTYLLAFLISYFTVSTDLARLESSSLFYVFIPVTLVLLLVYSLICRQKLSWKLFGTLPVIYLLYLAGVYFLKMTQNLANVDFDYRSFQGFFQHNFLAYLAFLLVIFYLSPSFIKDQAIKIRRRADRRKLSFIQLSSPEAPIVILSQITTMIFMTSDLFKNAYLNNSLFPLQDKVLTVNLYYLIFYALTFFILYSYLTYSAFMAVKQVAQNKVSHHLSLTTSVLLAVVVNHFVQAGITENWSWYLSYPMSGSMIFQISFLTGIYLLVYALFNRYLLATVVNLILGIAFVLINGLKYQLRNEPLLIGDFVWIRDIKFFAAYISVNQAVWVALGILSVGIFLYWSRKRFLPGPLMTLFQRLVVLISFVLVFYSSFIVIGSVKDKKIATGIPVLSSIYNDFSKPWLGINASAKFQSVTFLWFKQLTATTMEHPEGYSEEKIAELYDKYMERSKEINEERKKELSGQTVIYILSESSSDPGRIPGITLSQDVIPNIRDLQEKTTSGLMKSDGYGGGTANMEFQTLTGLPMYNFNDMISVLYTEVVPKMTLMPAISDVYDPANRYVIHLNNASNYSRKSVYSKLNFDTFVATSNGDLEPTDVAIFGNNYSDEASYNNVLDLLDEKESQFFSLLTIQNHSPWGETAKTDISATGEGFTETQNASLTNYSRLLYETDQATKEFLDKLKELDKEITVVFYGDHLPSLYPQEIFSSNPDLQYQAEFFVWSNRNNSKLEDISYVNSSDFPALLLEHTNSKVSGYYALLTDVLHQASVNQDKLSEEQQIIADDLKMLQYDLTQGRKYIKNYTDFFE